MDARAVRELCARAPSEFVQHARNPARSVRIGGPNAVFAPVYGPPFVRCLNKGRRYGTLADFRNLVRLTHALPSLHHFGGVTYEPCDLPVDKRHLDMVHAHLNVELLRPGTRLRSPTFDARSPPHETYRRYCCQFHGVGQCDEFPEIDRPEQWDEWGYDGELEAGMVLTLESYVGPRAGGEGVKLENQVLVTANGPELLTDAPLALR